ncbi:type I polyketide synthase [Variovorax sp. J22R115]|uniref:type I polyketide synthase n=1 Tax=Variovorax sp. J22R115 TaxID=3053509 RepID=UPI002577AE43|nr:type I polyketide synthase [Variovorax sp. J22R115]MDM0053600.1 SDR family NAD(P)-dependent oxidoreductase [Variovorax sp. J22R115]
MTTPPLAPSDDRQRAQLARALAALKDVRTQLDALKRQAQAEPIAIVGIGCRYPGGVEDADSFWQLLADGRDAIGEVPPERWNASALHDPDPAAVGKISSRSGGFLSRIDEFDPQFFGISPREAMSVDPQQRLLLEVAWEALEHAGIAADRLRGSPTGVFVGISGTDYAQLLMAAGPELIDSYMGSGNAHSVAAGRLSYVFGFEGPSLAVDTACSSSLVTVHLACQSLRMHECELALAGGVNALLTPTVSITHSRARMLAADGRCKAFDARADGFVRSEGCGVVVLKRLSAARAAGDAVLAVIRGSAVNQDGHSSGLTVPSGPSQQAVIRRALAVAGASPSEVSYVEAHGTGTALGDPIELQALAEVFAGTRPQGRPLAVGSVKTNFGHAEAAAGIAGLIKVVLALGHETIPAHLHFRDPNPRIAWARMPFVVPGAAMRWPRDTSARVAGVSSFGFGGTNAHVVLADAPPAPPPAAPAAAAQRPLQLLALSAQSDDALKALAARMADHLERHPQQPIGDVCHAANVGRAQLRQRLCALADGGAGIAAQLRAHAAGRDAPGLLRHDRSASARPPRIAFLFTGQGSQYPGMARRLFETEPAFRRDLERCDALLAPQLERRLLEVLHPASPDGALDRTEYTQPALFALEYCLGRLWMSWGVVPDLLVGHSLGEYAAACLAGVFELEDGLRLVVARAQAMQRLPAGGAMASVLAGEGEVRAAIAASVPDIEIAAINGPHHVVVSGARGGVARLREHLAAQGVTTQPLNVSHAFHSALIEPMLTGFGQVASSVAWSSPRLDLVSNLTGELAGAEVAAPGYWVRHAREAVRFLEGMRTLDRHGVDVCVEIGPHPVLLGLGRSCVPHAAAQKAWLPSLRRGQDDMQTLLGTLAALWVRGTPVDWRSFDGDRSDRRVRLPTYPFQRLRYWSTAATAPTCRARPRDPALHPLLGARHERACQPEATVWEGEFAAGEPQLLDEHRVFGAPLMPASGYVELALAAAATLGVEASRIADLVFHRPLTLEAETARVVQTSLLAPSSEGRPLQVHSRAAEGSAAGSSGWTLHATGLLSSAGPDPLGTPPDTLDTLRSRIIGETTASALYAGYARHGVEFGPSMRAVERLWRGEREALGRLRVPDTDGARDPRYRLHPLWLDACAQVLGATTPEGGATWLQTRMDELRIHRRPATTAWAHARLRPGSDAVRVADLRLYDDAGEVLIEVTGLHARPAGATLLRPGGAYYELSWVPPPGDETLLPSPALIATELRPRLDRSTAEPGIVAYADALAALDARAPARAAAALRLLGWRDRIGETRTGDDLQSALGIVPRHRRLFGRLLDMLARYGALRRDGEGWMQTAGLPVEDPVGDTTAAAVETQLFDRCTARLGDVLAGRCDPLPLLFGDGGRKAAAVYGDSPGVAAMHDLLRSAVAAMARSRPAGPGLRVIEIGAGTGGATAHVLPALPPRSEYVYTDVSAGYFAAARERFAPYRFLRYETLDIERPPRAQGFAEGAFDVAIVFNVLHATRSLAESVAHARSLLAPGGVLLLLENTEPADWVDLIWGLTPGWWRFEDSALRPSYPLLDAGRWRDLLAAEGFAEVESIAADPTRHPVMARQALIVARNGQAEATPRSRSWLLFVDAGGIGHALARSLQARGDRVVRASRGSAFAQTGADEFEIDPTRPGDVARLLGHLADGPAALGVVHLWALDARDCGECATDAMVADSIALSASALHLVQALVPAWSASTVWLVTRGACVAGGTGEPPPALAAAALCGIGLTIAREHPQLWGAMLDLDRPRGPGADAAAILQLLDAPGSEDRIALRGGRRLVPRIVPSERAVASAELAVTVHGQATYLISGGCGALGLEIAHWLVGQGARHLTLLGRSGAAGADAQQAIAALERLGASVHVVRADVADETAVRQALDAIRASGFALRGIVHAAGLPGRCTLAGLDLPTLARLHAAKVAGTWALHRATRGDALDFFVACSSMVSLWGAREQGHYVAANHFVDLFVHHRRMLGLPALGINWGPLGGGGMLPEADVAELERIGVSTTSLSDAARDLGQLLAANVTQAAVVRIDWPRLRDVYQSRGRCRLFDVVADGARAAVAAAGAAPAAVPDRLPDQLPERLRGVPHGERRAIVVEHVQATLARVLGLDAARLPDRAQSFFDLGMDSLIALELRTQLQASVGANLPSTLAFDYGTVDALADFLLSRVLAQTEVAASTTPSTTPSSPQTAPAAPEHVDLARLSDAEVEDLLQAKLLTS